ncbi:MAG: Molybdopterin biosynthesis protein MoeA Periplasmic molybdatebinding domain [Enterovirga sp.]|nr:Molybdopterin biosynthesis protein MoeA Periplasmic molybdatebinding domain [Enterovirga sp.]
MNSVPRDIPSGTAQEQFLSVLSRDEALRRFEAALDPKPVGTERVSLAAALGRVIAADIPAAIDVPPFDRALVDGFAVRSADLAGASEAAPVLLRLNPETIACGVLPALAVLPGTATPIATGGPIPRGADAVIMIETTEPSGTDSITVRRPIGSGAFLSFAGSDITAGETLVRRGTIVGSREVGVLAAVGLAELDVWRRPRVGIISTGDELVAPGQPLGPASIYDSNGPVVAAAVAENGGEPVSYGAVPDEDNPLRAAIRRAHAECDMVVLSGGTSKGAGDLTYRLIGELGEPGIVAHGVALKPGKPLLLAVCSGKPVVVLPGFPTSAMFTFHDMVAPSLRRLAGLPPRAAALAEATLPMRIPSELGRTEFVMVSLVGTEAGLAAYPLGKGSGSVTAFSHADGFISVEALADSVPAGTRTEVTLFTPYVTEPDLVVMGSHCVGLEPVISRLAEMGFRSRLMAVGSQGGLAAARRGECDVAPIHLVDPETGIYNRRYLAPGLELVEGWRRMQGLVFRRGDPRFENRSVADALAAALADPDCHMVNRNAGAGTRIVIDGLLKGARPEGYSNQPRSHNAVAAAVARGRADWGIAIAPVASAYQLGFIPVAEEHFDFVLVSARRGRPGVAAFVAALADPAIRDAVRRLGFRPADEA